MADLKSKKLIVVKGVLFLIIALCSFALILIQFPSFDIVLLLLCLIWSSCRFYYFLFYVLEKYVDSSLRYAGIWALIQAIIKKQDFCD